MLAFAQATEDTSNQVLGVPADAKQTEAKKTTLLKTTLELTKEIAALKKNINQTPSATSGGGGDADGGNTEKKKCKHCCRAHLEKTPKVLCFERLENASKVPEWYKRAKAKRKDCKAKK